VEGLVWLNSSHHIVVSIHHGVLSRRRPQFTHFLIAHLPFSSPASTHCLVNADYLICNVPGVAMEAMRNRLDPRPPLAALLEIVWVALLIIG